MLSKKQANEIANLFNNIQVSENLANNDKYDFKTWWGSACTSIVELHDKYGITLPNYQASVKYLADNK